MRQGLIRRLARFAPPSVRRSVAGAVVDLKTLPARLRDPARRAEPWAFRHNVGNGDFQAVGRQLVETLVEFAGFTGAERVLDIGCGSGRAAAPMAPMLAAHGGAYIGFDVSKSAIAFCRRRFAEAPHIRFEHLDVRNGDYNPKGRIAELETRFPAADASIDLAFATSVFTHMRMAPVRRYLAEAARVLAPGGRFAFTAFSVSPGRERSAEFDFKPFDETSLAVHPEAPERAIAHRHEVVVAAIADAGLELQSFHRGYWHTPADYDSGQDLFVVVKPRRDAGSRRPG